MKDQIKQEITKIINDRCEAELGQVSASSMGGKVIKTVDTSLIAKDICEYLTENYMVFTKEIYQEIKRLETEAISLRCRIEMEKEMNNIYKDAILKMQRYSFR